VKDESESKKIPSHVNYYGSIKSQDDHVTIENDYGKIQLLFMIQKEI